MINKVFVKGSAVRKILSLHPWIYRNEIDKVNSKVNNGDIVYVYSPDGDILGTGYINLNSKIAVRILSFFKEEKIDEEFIFERIKRSYYKRKDLFKNTDAFRVVHSEADGLPGLIVDKYSKYLSIQINTAGMERFREIIVDSLKELDKVEGIVDKSDEKVREKEGLKTNQGIIFGLVPQKIKISENNIEFYVHLLDGQKTGFYLDQRVNRYTVSQFVKEGFKILDLFSNSGGFGIYSMIAGGSEVTFVDVSKQALRYAEENCILNRIKNFKVLNFNVFDLLSDKKFLEKKYDLIILDPPSFAKNKNEVKGAVKGFKFLVDRSLKILKYGGFLAVFSCSYHVDMNILYNILKDVSYRNKYKIEILKHLFQDLDHPYILNIPNSLYLKGFLVRKDEN
ncbi:class I SAM-dependent rRNA methyltransferase [Persephonella sp.]